MPNESLKKKSNAVNLKNKKPSIKNYESARLKNSKIGVLKDKISKNKGKINIFKA